MRLTLVMLAVMVAFGVQGLAQPLRKDIPDWPGDRERPAKYYVPQHDQSNPDIPLPQDALLIPTLENIALEREDMQVALVSVDLGLGNENPFWQMSQTALTVFLNRLATLEQAPVLEDRIWPYLSAPDPRYRGILVMLQTKSGRRFMPMRLYQGKLIATDDSRLARDPGRRLEYWLFGTARVRRDQLVGSRVLPIFTFEQCRVLGQRIVETTPRQCLLADNNLLLETSEPPTLESAQLRNFDDCLQQGRGLIYTFPRRCVAAGGRVFTEPPQVFETPIPADMPIVTPKAKRLAPTPAKPKLITPTALLPVLVTPSVVTPTGLEVSPALVPGKPTWADLGGSKKE